jgi:amidase
MRTIPMTPPIGLSPISIGSDVAISVRGPAAFTGIAALKATHGRIPYTGHFHGTIALELAGTDEKGEVAGSEDDRGPALGQQASGARMRSEAEVALGTEAGPDGRRIGRDPRKMGPDEALRW